MTKLAASILAADFGNLDQQIRAVVTAGAEWVHVDVMDGHFVPNISVGVPVVASVRPTCDELGALLDVHLMIQEPDRYVEDFARAGAQVITVHVEACNHLHRTLQHIKQLGALAGVALNPATPLSALDEILTYVDLVLVMSVNPGFGGQAYIPETTGKIARLRRELNAAGRPIYLEVDGGISPDNAGEVVEAGANVIVAGSAVFGRGSDVGDKVRAMQREIAAVSGV